MIIHPNQTVEIEMDGKFLETTGIKGIFPPSADGNYWEFQFGGKTIMASNTGIICTIHGEIT